jgi:hypothetical protein
MRVGIVGPNKDRVGQLNTLIEVQHEQLFVMFFTAFELDNGTNMR